MSEETCAAGQSEQYKWDEKLEIYPSRSSWEMEVSESTKKVLAACPSLDEFISLAFHSYEDQKQTESTQNPVESSKLDTSEELERDSTKTTKHKLSKNASGLSRPHGFAENWINVASTDSSKLGKTPDGFGLLAEATNKSTENGYIGAAFIHKEKMQIILSHRENKLVSSEAQIADYLSLNTSQILSAMTFAHEVSLFALETRCELFFTGNSPGGCLAHITCFSVKYLTMDHDTRHFVRKPADQWDKLHPYTVVFNSRGSSHQFLQKLKDDLTPPKELQPQEINVARLPVEQHQLNSDAKMKNTPNNANIFPSYFLTTKELDLLKEQKNKIEEEGSYEGLSLEEEEAANNLVDISRGIHFLENGTIELRGGMDTKELIPLVKYIAHKLEDEKIWWNPRKKAKLPHNYIQRTFCRTADPKRNTTILSLLEIKDDFVLLVGDPGTGISVAMTDLEYSLRKHISSNRIIIRINLSHVKIDMSKISGDCALSVLVNLSPFLPLKTLQMEGIRVVVLLDGLEICQRNHVTMSNLLRILKPRESNQSQHSHLRIILTAPRHLGDAIESEFTVKSWSLCPLTKEDKVNMIKAELGITRENSTEFLSFVSWPFENPRMLLMLLDFLKSGGCISAISDHNIYNFYTRFVEVKHEPLLEVERLKAHMEKQIQSAQHLNVVRSLPVYYSPIKASPFVKMRLESMLNRNLPFYFHVAWNQLLRGDYAGDAMDISLPSSFTESIESVAIDSSSDSEVTKLLNFGLLVQNKTGQLVFKHRSLAEFFLAMLMIQPETPEDVKDTLFRYTYRSPLVLEYVKIFIFIARGYIYQPIVCDE